MRRASTFVLVCAAALSLAGCDSELYPFLGGRELDFLGGRELVCQGVPRDLCARLAELGLSRLDLAEVERDVGPVPKIAVYPQDCASVFSEFGVPANVARCWEVEANNEWGGQGLPVYQWVDGSLNLRGAN